MAIDVHSATSLGPNRSSLQRATASAIERASASFSTRTSGSLDGIHTSHYQHLSDAGLEALSA
eukprot:1543112-Pyramimonas_sp.AAC.1